MFKLPSGLQKLSRNAFPFLEVSYGVMRFVDQINPLVGTFSMDSLNDSTDILEINFTNKNMSKFQQKKREAFLAYGVTEPMPVDKSLVENIFIDCTLTVGAEEYRAKLKFHAGADPFPKAQYRIKLKKEKLYDNIRTFSLCIFRRT